MIGVHQHDSGAFAAYGIIAGPLQPAVGSSRFWPRLLKTPESLVDVRQKNFMDDRIPLTRRMENCQIAAFLRTIKRKKHTLFPSS
jgi:hypothetical protein